MGNDGVNRKERLIKWLPAKMNIRQDAQTVSLRAKAVGMPALLVVRRSGDGHRPNQMLINVRMQHWRKGPLGSVTSLEPVVVANRRFSRTVFEIYNPRRSTVLSAATELDNAQSLVVQFVVAGFGRVEGHLDQIYQEAIQRALEVNSRS